MMLGRPKNRRRKEPQEAGRRWLPQINWRRLATSAASIAGVCLVVAGTLWALDQPIQTVSVSGRFQRVAPGDVERIVKRQVRGVGLLSVDLAAVRKALHQIPWVDAVSVQRAWPRGLNVLVIEQVAAARWGDSGLLNRRGELFATGERHIPPELAQLSGPDGKEALVAQKYLAVQGRLMQAGLRMTALRLDARGAWEFDLSDGVTVRLGRRQFDERFEKFMAAALKLVTQRGDDIQYVDMRYTNGFAIGWRAAVGLSQKDAHGPPRAGAVCLAHCGLPVEKRGSRPAPESDGDGGRDA
jgi:cell division protein FtsQ